MKSVVICSKGEVETCSQEEHVTHVISIQGHGKCPLTFQSSLKVLHLTFDDLEGDSRGPQEHHIQKIWDFIAELNLPENLVVHCTFGQSRSAAVGILVNAFFAVDSRQLIESMLTFKGRICPNWQVLEQAFAVVDNFTLMRAVEACKFFNRAFMNQMYD